MWLSEKHSPVLALVRAQEGKDVFVGDDRVVLSELKCACTLLQVGQDRKRLEDVEVGVCVDEILDRRTYRCDTCTYSVHVHVFRRALVLFNAAYLHVDVVSVVIDGNPRIVCVFHRREATVAVPLHRRARSVATEGSRTLVQE